MVIALPAPRPRRRSRPSHLERYDGPWGNVHETLRAAVLDHLAEPYLRLGHPTDEDFAVAFDVAPGTDAFRAAWERELARRKVAHHAAYRDSDWISILSARDRDGTPVVVGTMLTVRSARTAGFAAAIGNPESELPTLRLLHFACGPDSGLATGDIAERDVAELARLCIKQVPDLATLAGEGALRLADAAFVADHAFDEFFARAYWRDRALPNPPRAYLGNTRPWLMSALERRGLDVRRLYLPGGAEPAPYVLSGNHPAGAFFGRWAAILAPLVPPAILARGVAAAIAHLGRAGFDGWDRLELSLPYCILNTPRTAAAMADLAQSCGLDAESPDLAA